MPRSSSSSQKHQIIGLIKSKPPDPQKNQSDETKDFHRNQSAATTPQRVRSKVVGCSQAKAEKRSRAGAEKKKVNSTSVPCTPELSQERATDIEDIQLIDSPQSPATKLSSPTSNSPNPSRPSPSTTKPSAQPEPKGLRRSLEYNNQKRKRLGISKSEDLQSGRDISACLAGFNLSLGAWTYMYLAGSFLGLLSPIIFLGLTAIFSKQAAEFQHVTQVMKRKQAAEKQIARLLEDHFAADGAEIRSLLHQNQVEIEAPQSYIPDYLDILLTFPNGHQFAIYVLALKGEKDSVFYDFKAKELRYRDRHGKKRWSISPLGELKRKVDWLSQHTSLISKPTTMILAFPNPVRVKAFDDSAVCVGQLKVTQVEDVYVVGEKDLIELINRVQYSL